jgi:hypothetical protein
VRTQDPTQRRLYLVSSQKSQVRLPSADDTRPIPAWHGVLVVLGVCVPFWAGLSWFVTEWL